MSKERRANPFKTGSKKAILWTLTVTTWATRRMLIDEKGMSEKDADRAIQLALFVESTIR